ncbi:MAG TPA: alpha/beta hydrolase, partial [Patescibacteria group bacterium]|nr:alpha/beta hydrolase [Patescibacteria group bacterium]
GPVMLKRLREAFNSVTELHRAGLEYAALATTWPIIKDKLPKGDGHPVIFFPGFLTSDVFTYPLQTRVEEKGYKIYGWDNGFNMGFDEKTAAHLKKRLKDVFDANGGQKVTLVGHSLGGIYARELAREFPDMVRDVITLGTPVGSLDDTAKATSEHLKNLYGFFNPSSVHDDIADIGARGLTPPSVPTTSLFSRNDGVVNPQATLNPKTPLTENIEVYGSHMGMTVNALTAAAVLDRLAQKEGEWQPFDKSKYPMLPWPKGVDDAELPANPAWQAGKATPSLFDGIKKPKAPPGPKAPKA